MDTPDQPYLRALLYLHAAGHDTGRETQARLQRLLTDHSAPEDTVQRLEQLSDAIGRPASRHGPGLPPIVRSSMGYPE